MTHALLKPGSKGPEVVRLQELLNARLSPSPRLVVNGSFDKKTGQAVKRFQQTMGLDADGIVGAKSWAALEAPSKVAEPAKPAAPAAPKPGASPQWMEIAKGEEGQAEVAGAGQHNTRIVAYHSATSLQAKDDETPWCSAFVNWVMLQSGHPGTRSALAKSWLSWGQPLNEPRYGAIAIIRSKSASGNTATGSSTGYHVGFLVEQTNTGVRLLGGNQSDSVRVSTFPLSKYTLEGYRWPA